MKSQLPPIKVDYVLGLIKLLELSVDVMSSYAFFKVTNSIAKNKNYLNILTGPFPSHT